MPYGDYEAKAYLKPEKHNLTHLGNN